MYDSEQCHFTESKFRRLLASARPRPERPTNVPRRSAGSAFERPPHPRHKALRDGGPTTRTRRHHRRGSMVLQKLSRGMASVRARTQRSRAAKRALVAAMIVNLPTPQDLAPWIEQLEAHPGSVVLIAVSNQRLQLRNMHTRALLSREKRKPYGRARESTEETRTGKASQDLSFRCDTRTETKGSERDPRAKERESAQ